MTTATSGGFSNGDDVAPSDVDEAFADLMSSNFGSESRQVLDSRAAPIEPSAVARIAMPDATSIVARAFGPRDWPTTPEVEALEDAQSRFTPPNPTGVFAATDAVRRAATIGAVVFPLLMIFSVIMRFVFSALAWPIWPGPIFAVLFVISLIVLLWRMPKHKEYRHDDGAVL